MQPLAVERTRTRQPSRLVQAFSCNTCHAVRVPIDRTMFNRRRRQATTAGAKRARLQHIVRVVAERRPSPFVLAVIVLHRRPAGQAFFRFRKCDKCPQRSRAAWRTDRHSNGIFHPRRRTSAQPYTANKRRTARTEGCDSGTASPRANTLANYPSRQGSRRAAGLSSARTIRVTRAARVTQPSSRTRTPPRVHPVVRRIAADRGISPRSPLSNSVSCHVLPCDGRLVHHVFRPIIGSI